MVINRLPIVAMVIVATIDAVILILKLSQKIIERLRNLLLMLISHSSVAHPICFYLFRVPC